MKKIVSILLVSIMCIGMVACFAEDKIEPYTPNVIVSETDEPFPVITGAPVSQEPTDEPTKAPEITPVIIPTEEPAEEPTEVPTEEPTKVPTEAPTAEPTAKATVKPTQKPTQKPTEQPTEKPTPIVVTTPTKAPTEAPTEVPTEQPTAEPTENTNQATLTGNFYTDLAKFLERNGYSKRNYLVSPTSLRAALCLAIAGAEGETKEELIKAAGFSSQNDANSWYKKLNDSIAKFAEETEQMNQPDFFGSGSVDRAFSLANSVWSNSSIAPDFKESYKKYVKDNYDAEARRESADKITSAVNDWCKEKTNGMIPKIADNLSEASSVLVNALYLKTQWEKPFAKVATKDDIFTTAKGKEVTKSFMENTERYGYYEDDDTQILVLKLSGDKQLVLILGSDKNLTSKLNQLQSTRVHVKVPKMDFETSMDDKMLIKFLQERGAFTAFTTNADFSAMADVKERYIDDIIQKTKIKTDEDGLEAAAVTAIVAKDAAMPIQEETKEFIANKTFKFIIFSGLGTSSQEALFYGQFAE